MEQRSKYSGFNLAAPMLLFCVSALNTTVTILALSGARLLGNCLLYILEFIFATPLSSDTVLINACEGYVALVGSVGFMAFFILSLAQTVKLADLLQKMVERYFPLLAKRQEWQYFIKHKIMQEPFNCIVPLIIVAYIIVMVIVNCGIDPALYPSVIYMHGYAWLMLLGQGLLCVIFRRIGEGGASVIKRVYQREVEKLIQERASQEESNQEKGD